MKFICLDVETTSDNEKTGLILEIGMVMVDLNTDPNTWAKYHKIVKHSEYYGDAYAIQMNNRLFRILAGVDKTDIPIVDVNDVAFDMYQFLVQNGMDNSKGFVKIIVAGKNPAKFDIPYVKSLPNLNDYIQFHYRTIDPTTSFTNLLNDTEPPSLSTCKERAGLPSIVTHNALEDCIDVIMLLAKKEGMDEKYIRKIQYLCKTF